MTMRTKLLDHGYVELVESWGSDARIIEAARMSTDKGFRGWERETWWECTNCHYTLVNAQDPAVGHNLPMCPTCAELMQMNKEESHPGDEKLLRYLYEHKHMTPFEMAGMTIEVQAPIFVFREWHRHRTQSYNELSARYTELPDMFYVPDKERIMNSAQSRTNKQASVAGLDALAARDVQSIIERMNQSCRDNYEVLLQMGVAREIARLVIPVSQYSRMRASANLRNWLRFLTLRMDPAAQWEIRQYANAVGQLIARTFPHTWKLFEAGSKT